MNMIELIFIYPPIYTIPEQMSDCMAILTPEIQPESAECLESHSQGQAGGEDELLARHSRALENLLDYWC